METTEEEGKQIKEETEEEKEKKKTRIPTNTSRVVMEMMRGNRKRKQGYPPIPVGLL
jgi:hypothetical protein